MIRDNRPFREDSTYADVIETLPHLYTKTAINTKLMLDEMVVKEVARQISHAQMVDIYGSGITSTLASNSLLNYVHWVFFVKHTRAIIVAM